MKYKVGDKVRIKTWEELEIAFGLDRDGDINRPSFADICFVKKMEREIKEKFSDRILTIDKVNNGFYVMEGFHKVWRWEDYMIKGLVIEMYTIFDPIESRFELMEL